MFEKRERDCVVVATVLILEAQLTIRCYIQKTERQKRREDQLERKCL